MQAAEVAVALCHGEDVVIIASLVRRLRPLRRQGEPVAERDGETVDPLDIVKAVDLDLCHFGGSVQRRSESGQCGIIFFRRMIDNGFELLGVLCDTDGGQRMVLRMSDGSSGGDQPLQQGQVIIQRGGVEPLDKVTRKGNGFALKINGFTITDELIERSAAGLDTMERGCVGVQLTAQRRRLLRFGTVLRRSGLFGDLGRLSELFEDIALLGLIGVQLEAERADADFIQALLHHLERRHFFRDKEHAFAGDQEVGDHRGDSL